MDVLVQTAMTAIKRIMADTSVDKETTNDRLQEVRDEIDMLRPADFFKRMVGQTLVSMLTHQHTVLSEWSNWRVRLKQSLIRFVLIARLRSMHTKA